MPYFFRVTFLALVLPVAVHAETIRIGVLTDLSGGMASWGRQTRIGAEIARDEINANGEKLTLVFGDHQLQAKTAVSEFLKMTEFDRVDAVYSEFTPTTVAIAPISQTKKIVVIYSAAAASPLAASPYIFKSYLDFVDGCRRIAEHWKARGISSVGMLKVNIEFGDLCARGLKEVFPEAVEVVYNPGDEVSAQVLVLKRRGVQALLNTAFEPDILHMLKALQNIGWNPEIAAQEDAAADQARSLFPTAVERITVFGLPRLAAEFIARVKEKDPTNNLVSISAAGLAYLHVKQLYDASAHCSRGDSDCMVARIAGAKADDVTGFKKWQDRIASFDVSLRTLSSGKQVK